MTAQARRQVIEVAASELFAERGYQGASIDEIARRSGVSAPVLYDHFESKEDLYKRLLERHLRELLDLWRAELAGDEPVDKRIVRALDAWFRYIDEHPAWLLVFRDAPPELREFHADLRAQSLGSLIPMMAREQAAGEPPGSIDPSELAMATEL